MKLCCTQTLSSHEGKDLVSVHGCAESAVQDCGVTGLTSMYIHSHTPHTPHTHTHTTHTHTTHTHIPHTPHTPHTHTHTPHTHTHAHTTHTTHTHIPHTPHTHTQSHLYYDRWWCGKHTFLVWANSFVFLSTHLLPPSYCQLLHQCALHLGCWTRCVHDESASV